MLDVKAGVPSPKRRPPPQIWCGRARGRNSRQGVKTTVTGGKHDAAAHTGTSSAIRRGREMPATARSCWHISHENMAARRSLRHTSIRTTAITCESEQLCDCVFPTLDRSHEPRAEHILSSLTMETSDMWWSQLQLQTHSLSCHNHVASFRGGSASCQIPRS